MLLLRQATGAVVAPAPPTTARGDRAYVQAGPLERKRDRSGLIWPALTVQRYNPALPFRRDRSDDGITRPAMARDRSVAFQLETFAPVRTFPLLVSLAVATPVTPEYVPPYATSVPPPPVVIIGTTYFYAAVMTAVGTVTAFTTGLILGVSANMSAIGTSLLSRIVSYNVSLTPTAVGTVSLTKQIGKFFSQSGVGTAALTKQVGKLLSASGVGTAALARVISKNFAMTAVGTLTSAQNFIAGAVTVVSMRYRRLITFLRRKR